VVSDARKGEVYASYYPRLDDRRLPIRVGEIVLIPHEETANWIDEVGDREARLVGTGVPYLLDKGVGESLTADGEAARAPSAADILAIATVKIDQGLTVDAAVIIPTYVRPPDAHPPSPGTVITASESRDPGPGARDK
jgi:tRNA A37 threonylcarbamoyladenosine modification protein TsaB